MTDTTTPPARRVLHPMPQPDGRLRYRHERQFYWLTRNFYFASLVNSLKCGNSSRIKAFSGQRLDDFQRSCSIACLLIRTVGGERVECVGHCNDASQLRNLVAF